MPRIRKPSEVTTTSRVRPTDPVSITMTRAEAQALLVVFDKGLAVVNALGLIANTGAAERGRLAVAEAVR
jgi:hypothetical protein